MRIKVIQERKKRFLAQPAQPVEEFTIDLRGIFAREVDRDADGGSGPQGPASKVARRSAVRASSQPSDDERTTSVAETW